MNGFITLIKMNIRLLLRNKGYLAFLFILPVLSVLILNVQNSNITEGQNDTYAIHELNKENQHILEVVNNKLNIKVYDCSQSKLSDYVLNQLTKSGSYQIYRYKSKPINLEAARDKAQYSANKNSIDAVIYIPDSFETVILNGDNSNMVVFEANRDGRMELLKNNLNTYIQSIYRYSAVAGYDKAQLHNLLEKATDNEMKKDIISIETGDMLNLTKLQEDQSSSIGYSLSFLTISFLFSGVFIAATVIEERQNRVYNRFVLSMSSLGNYGLSKMLMILITVLIQTGIIAVGIQLFVKTDFGIPFMSYLFFVFCLGLIFNSFSVVIGVLTNNVLSSNYIAFLVWCLSCILAGLYFPLDGASKWWIHISKLMPQRWVVKAAEMLMVGKSGVYSMFLLVMLSYLIVISCTGLLGIKITRKE